MPFQIVRMQLNQTRCNVVTLAVDGSSRHARTIVNGTDHSVHDPECAMHDRILGDQSGVGKTVFHEEVSLPYDPIWPMIWPMIQARDIMMLMFYVA